MWEYRGWGMDTGEKVRGKLEAIGVLWACGESTYVVDVLGITRGRGQGGLRK